MNESINARFRQMREKLNKSQSEMGEDLGLKQGAISKMEREGGTITEANLKLLENIYRANIEWLKTGIGEMFHDDTDSLGKIADQLKLTDIQKKVFLTLMGLPDDRREIIAKAFWAIYQAGHTGDDMKKK